MSDAAPSDERVPQASHGTDAAGPVGGFVGRRAELDAIAVQTELARGGALRVVVVEGPAGIGKTTLLRHVASRGTDTNRTLRAVCSPAEEHFGFGALEQLVRRVDPSLARELVEVGPEPPVAGLRLVDVLQDTTADGPLTIVVDDAHWIDGPSLAALGVALRRVGHLPILVVLAARDDGSPVAAHLRRLVTDLGGVRLPLRGLATDEVAQLGVVAGVGRLRPGAARRLHDVTRGNPLHATAMIEDIGVDALSDADRPLEAPATYAVLVLGRLEACGPTTQELVRAASILGDVAPWHVVRAMVPGAGFAELDEARSAGLLEVEGSDVGTTVSWKHPLTRVAVHQDLALVARTSLHRRAADHVADPEAALTHRVRATPKHDPELAALLEEAAATTADRGDPLGAATRLLEGAGLQDDPAERARLRIEAVELLLAGGDTHRAAALATEVDADRAADPARRAHVRGLVAFAEGRFSQAEALLLRAWDAADVPAAARIAETLCHLLYLQLRVSNAVVWGERARDGGRPATSWLATSLALDGRGPAGGTPGTGVQAALARGAERLWTDDLASARVELREAVRGLRARGQFGTGLQALGYLALAEFRLGAWDDAVANAEEAVALAVDARYAWILARLHAFAVLPLAARGRFDDAGRHLVAAAAAARTTGLPLDIAGVAVAGANVAAARGDHQAVVDGLGALVRSEAHLRTGEPGVSIWPCLYAEALVALGRPDEVDDVLDPYETAATSRGRRSAIAEAARVRGVHEAALGRDEEAAASFERAAGHADAPFTAALVGASHGSHLRRRGHRREAERLLSTAHGRFAALGAAPYAARCARELDACGLHPASRRAGDRDRLTPRERTVADLAARGASNRAIAVELVVSVNTVEFHMRNVFAKLGVRSRTEIASRLATPADREGGTVPGT